MILTRLLGGLGNQLFQYAAARALAWRHRTGVLLDVSWFSSQTTDREEHSRFSLDHFQFTPQLAAAEATRRFTGNPPTRAERWARRAFRRARLPRLAALLDPPGTVFAENSVGPYRSAFAQLPDDTYLAGMWQSEKYFADIAPLLRAELELRAPPSGPNAAWLARLAAGKAPVAVHVRRGDYVRNPDFARGLGTCGAEYYRAAIAALRHKHPAAELYVFSDEPAAARELLAFEPGATFVDHNRGPFGAVEDLRLMRACRHHIIANSTFGWWAAWLAAHPQQTAIAPAVWFRGFDYDSRDLLPPSWQRL